MIDVFTSVVRNPYAEQDFFSFFGVLIQRIVAFFLGRDTGPLVSDEIQCIVLILLGLSLAFLGSFLVLKQMTMVANALSHTLLVGVVLAFLLLGGQTLHEPQLSIPILSLAAIFTGVITTVLIHWLTQFGRVQEDASIGLVFTTLFAIGILLVTLFTRNTHLGVEAVMGNMDALHIDDVIRTSQFTLLLLGVFLFLFRGFFSLSFDPVFTRILGWPTSTLNYLLMILTAGAAIIAFRAVGVLLFLSLLVGPILIARLWTNSLYRLIVYGFLVSGGTAFLSVALSRHLLSVYALPLSTSGLVSTMLLCEYLFFVFCKKATQSVFFVWKKITI